jgi:wyosine [tRNA(Phe)-imidazoG37] synthetase (radical SAM superfamily)
MIAFGPIPSRRLGRSLGVNNIPPKICSYSCVYCQVGLTDSMSIERKEFYPLEEIVTEVSERVEQLIKSDEKIDYITFVPDGEPTLDMNLGKEIQLLKPLGINIAVITNSSLLWDKEVREDLLLADWISVKIDTADEKVWHKINRPYGKLDLQKVLNGVRTFRNSYKGTLVTETMLVKGLNDSKESLTNTAEFIGKINPGKAYILVPTRPPAEKFVEPPPEENINMAYQIFNTQIKSVELLTGGEGSDFTYSSDVEKELLGILAVHPMKKEAVEIFLNKAETDWKLIKELINKNILREVQYSATAFIIKNVRVKSKN